MSGRFWGKGGNRAGILLKAGADYFRLPELHGSREILLLFAVLSGSLQANAPMWLISLQSLSVIFLIALNVKIQSNIKS